MYGGLMASLQKQVKKEISEIMDRYTGAMDQLVKAYAKRRNSKRDIAWLALQASKEFGAIRTHARIMMSRAKAMEPIKSVKKSAHDSAEEIDHYYGYREILEFYYPGTKLGVSAQGFSWQSLSGERVEVMTTSSFIMSCLIESSVCALIVEIETSKKTRKKAFFM